MVQWDTAGVERYRCLTSNYYRRSHAALVVYDVSDFQSFRDVEKWIAEIDSCEGEKLIKVLIGNKCDLLTLREITKARGKEFADTMEMAFFETSAKTGEGLEECFERIVSLLLEKQTDLPQVVEGLPPEQKSSGCC